MFDNEAEKIEALKALPELLKHPGWKFIERAIDADVAALESILRERKDFTDLQEVYKTQDLRDATQAFKSLPDRIMAAAKDELPDTEDGEIYDTAAGA